MVFDVEYTFRLIIPIAKFGKYFLPTSPCLKYCIESKFGIFYALVINIYIDVILV